MKILKLKAFDLVLDVDNVVKFNDVRMVEEFHGFHFTR